MYDFLINYNVNHHNEKKKQSLLRKKHLKNVDCEADKEVSSDMCQNTEKV